MPTFYSKQPTHRRFMPIDERAIVAKVLAGYTDPNYEERPGFFPFKLEADRIVTALETARADATISRMV
jgi:hypothetical protein